MSIEQKMASATTVLTMALRIIPLCTEHIGEAIGARDVIFKDIREKEGLTEAEKENEIDVATVGLLITILARHQWRYRNLDSSGDILSPYLWDENGKKSAYYSVEYADIEKQCNVFPNEQQQDTFIADYARLALVAGAKVMNGELPFQPEILNKIIDKHTPEAREIHNRFAEEKYSDNADRDRLKQKFSDDLDIFKAFVDRIAENIIAEKITDVFDEAFLAVSTNQDTPEKRKFRDALSALQQATQDRLKKNEAGFGISDAKMIANSALELATKVNANRVTQADVDQFTQATQKHTIAFSPVQIAIETLINVVTAMIIGVSAGLMLGGVPGAAVGAAAGIVVGVVLTGVSTMWHNGKKAPLNAEINAVTSAAEDACCLKS